MSSYDGVKPYSNWHQEANRMLRWLGAENTRHDITGQSLQRRPNESSYQYFDRWLQCYGATLGWKKTIFSEESEHERVLWRPTVNGYDLSACSVGIAASLLRVDEYRAKEDACEALVAAYRCFKRL
ncbi:hypothetical protein OPQ81_001058 [Rhizoctonia solani]|nr:hypothetical protein OPQ81_001058 [Rhizoctonia solani]